MTVVKCELESCTKNSSGICMCEVISLEMRAGEMDCEMFEGTMPNRIDDDFESDPRWLTI